MIHFDRAPSAVARDVAPGKPRPRWVALILLLLLAVASPVHGQRKRKNDAAKSDKSSLASIKTIRSLPRNDVELQLAHARSRGLACQTLAAEEPLEVNDFTPYLTPADRQDDSAAPPPSTRRHMFSVGLDILPDDQTKLPLVSRRPILNYLDRHFVTIQARVQKDVETDALYLHHLPLAATGTFRGAKLTQGFEPVVANSIREFHSLGLFVKDRKPATPESLRTLVLLYRSPMLSVSKATGQEQKVDNFEFVFVRAHEAPSTERFTLHVFATANERKVLHYLRPFSPPARVGECGIHASILVTEYQSRVFPKESVVRKFGLRSRESFPLAKLDEYARAQSWRGDALDNLSDTLDAIIAARVGK